MLGTQLNILFLHYFDSYYFVILKLFKNWVESLRCLSVRQSYRDLIKLGVRQSINISKLRQIYQDIILILTLTINPSRNNDFDNFC